MIRHFVLLVLFSSAFFQLFGQPIAQFQASLTEGCVPLVVNFEDQSTGAVAWEWDLGTGTSTLQAPGGVYASAGSYTIRLIVTDANGLKDTLVRTDYLQSYALPIANFTQDLTEICTYESVQFTDISQAGSGNITQWQWDFGDGNLSTEPNPLHLYTSKGTFPVSLEVINQYGCSNTFTQQGLIQTNAPDPSFVGDELIACGAPLTVQFTSTGTIVGTHTWDFGDGSTANSLNPTHTFQSNGNFSIQHIVIDAEGCSDTLTRIDYVNLGLNTLGAYAEDSSFCQYDTMRLHSTAASNSTVVWDLGNGDTLVGLHPKYRYPQAGTYQVSAHISDPSGCERTIFIPIEVFAVPFADFTVADTTVGCEVPFQVEFVNLTTNGQTYEWTFSSPTGSGPNYLSTDFEPVLTYTAVDTFWVVLNAYGQGGCFNRRLKRNFIQIQEVEAGFTADQFEGCAPLDVSFTDTTFSPFPLTQWEWTLGDGNTASLANPSHTYQDTGWYD
ncbi:MAG: PKD domain-containing protein, partial [Bacteroidota bacterium]